MSDLSNKLNVSFSVDFKIIKLKYTNCEALLQLDLFIQECVYLVPHVTWMKTV